MSTENDRGFQIATLLKYSLMTVLLSTIQVYHIKSHKAFLPFGKSNSLKASPVSASKKLEKKKKKTIYLSFDDGPNAGTEKVRRILKDEKVAATLFIIGEHINGSKAQKAIYDSLLLSEEIELANHSFTHAHNAYSKFYNNTDSVVMDFKKCADSFRLKNNIARTPGRNIWRTANINCTDINTSIAAADSLYQNGFKLVGWDLEWHFTNDQHLVQSDSLLIQQIEETFKKEQSKTKHTLVLLAHDRSFLSAGDSGSLHQFIKKMKASNKYDFETLSKYPGLLKD
jgi:ribosome-interacting GTPase 1